MKMSTEELLNDLTCRTRQNLEFAEKLKRKSGEELNWRKDENSWSILECLQHLILYGNYYLPELGKASIKALIRLRKNLKRFFGKLFCPNDASARAAY